VNKEKVTCQICDDDFTRLKDETFKDICLDCFKASQSSKITVTCNNKHLFEKVTCQICEDVFTRLKTETWRDKCIHCFKASQESKITVTCNKCSKPFKIEPDQKTWRKVCGKCYYNK
jgi:hypothetical protein